MIRTRVTYCRATQSVFCLHLREEQSGNGRKADSKQVPKHYAGKRRQIGKYFFVSLQLCPNRENAHMQHSAHVRVLTDREFGQTTNEIK